MFLKLSLARCMTYMIKASLAISGSICALIFFICFVLLRLSLTKRIKKTLLPKGEYWDSGTLDFDFINTAIFCFACAVPKFAKQSKFQSLYPNLDVRNIANKFEVTLALLLIISLTSFFTLGFVMLITDITGYLQWD